MEATLHVAHLPDAGHRVGVDVLTVSEGQSAVGTLDLEPKFLIESYCSGIIHVDAQFDAREIQPVVRQVQRRLHQRRPYPLALPVVTHGHPDTADVTHAPAGRGGLQAEASDHLALHTGHQRIQTLRKLRKSLAPHLGPRERHLQRARHRPWAAEDALKRLVVLRLRVTDGYFHMRLRLRSLAE